MDEPSTSSSSNDTEEKFCEICLLNTSERLVLVTSKGKEGLKAASKERLDKLFTNMDNSKTVYVHHTCRSNYVHKGNIAASAKRAAVKNSVSPTKKKLRRSSSSSLNATLFDWDKNCFICDNEINTLQEKKSVCNEKENFESSVFRFYTKFSKNACYIQRRRTSRDFEAHSQRGKSCHSNRGQIPRGLRTKIKK